MSIFKRVLFVTAAVVGFLIIGAASASAQEEWAPEEQDWSGFTTVDGLVGAAGGVDDAINLWCNVKSNKGTECDKCQARCECTYWKALRDNKTLWGKEQARWAKDRCVSNCLAYVC